MAKSKQFRTKAPPPTVAHIEPNGEIKSENTRLALLRDAKGKRRELTERISDMQAELKALKDSRKGLDAFILASIDGPLQAELPLE